MQSNLSLAFPPSSQESSSSPISPVALPTRILKPAGTRKKPTYSRVLFRGKRFTMSDGYDYRSCPLTKPNDIRLLTINQGFANDLIECMLTTYPLPTQGTSTPTSQIPPYEALSYYWGSGNASLKIKIYTPGFPETLLVRSNLHAALNQLRLPDRPRELWIDAVCINQDDDDERSAQVSLMADIYKKATSVCVWLGEASPDSNLALDFISRIVKLDEFDRLVADEKTPQEWAALSSLMRRPWSRRTVRYHRT